MTFVIRHLKKLFLDNFYLKAGSFILAIMLWLVVQYQGQIEEKVELEINASIFKKLPENEVVNLYKKTAEFVTVKMRGLPSAMSKIEKEVSLSVEIPENFSDWGKEVPFELMHYNIQHPLGVEILNIAPSKITVLLDFFDEKKVGVVKNYGGIPPEGYKVDNVFVSPEMVKIFGPRSLLEGTKQILTDRIDISDLTAPTTKKVKLILNEYTTCLPEYVDVTVDIKEIIEERLFANLQMRIKNLPGTSATIEPKTVSVTIEGPQNVIKTLNENFFTIILDVQELPLDKWREVTPKVEFQPELSPGLKGTKFEPGKIKVKVLKTRPNEVS